MKNEIQPRQNEYSDILKSIQKAVDESDVTPDEFIEFLHANMTIVNQFFANYECAALEVETKFKVLNNQAPRGHPRKRKNPSLEAWRASKGNLPSAPIVAK